MKKFKYLSFVLVLFFSLSTMISFASEDDTESNDVVVSLKKGKSDFNKPNNDNNNQYKTEKPETIKKLPQTGEIISLFLLLLGVTTLILFLLILLINKILFKNPEWSYVQ